MNRILGEIKRKLKRTAGIKIVSFDIFDTLLFRDTVIPDRVFWEMYRKKKKAFPDFTTIGDWVSSRKTAEREARRISKEACGNEEITLKDIYDHLPSVYENTEELMELEMTCECEMAVLNKEVLEAIEYLKSGQGKEILLISDMYLSVEQISSILKTSGLDLTLINKIYVSSEAGHNKKSGELFQIVLHEQQLYPGELFHIGDSMQNDILPAKKLGILAYYYNFISESQFKYPFLLCEQEAFDAPLCEKMYLTRILADRRNLEIEESGRFFFTVGSMMVGPFITFAAEWVIDVALKEKIYKIRPFMREGRFLTELLLRAMENRGAKLSIEPLYISRLAAYNSRLEDITGKEISVWISGAKTTPRDIFRLLQIEDLLYHFDTYNNIPFTDLRSVYNSDGNSIYETIYQYLSSPETLDIIHKRNNGKKQVFLDYLEQMGLLESAITLDIGWNGTTMNAVYKAIREKRQDAKLLQLLFCSSKNVAKNAVDGCVIKGFIGNYGGLQGKFNRIFIPIFELFCLCEEGPTIGYKYCGEKVVPVLDKNVYSEAWLSNIAALQRGVMAFQEEYFSMCRQKSMKIDVKKQGIQALSMIERLLSSPYFQEIKYLRTAELDQNIGIENRVITVLEDDLCLEYQKKGLERFYKSFRNIQQSITWHQALPVLCDPLFYLKMIYLQKAKYGKLSTILLIEQAVRKAGVKKILIVIDAQTLATDLAMIYFKAMGAFEKVAGIASINECIAGEVYNGFNVSILNNTANAGVYFITIKEKRSYNLLREKIIMEKGEQVNIVGYYEED